MPKTTRKTASKPTALASRATLSLREGIFDGIHADDYHADPCLTPSLSSTIAQLLCLQSPAHAYHAHPRLNASYAPEHSAQFDLGKTAHDVLLRGSENVVKLAFPTYQTKDAKAARDLARQQGRIPILQHQWDDVAAMVAAARTQFPRGMFKDGKPSRTLVWREPEFGNIWCRARLDYHDSQRQQIDDYKTTAASAAPERWTRTMFEMGADIRVAFQLRGLRMLGKTGSAFQFFVQENYAPFAGSVVTLGPAAMTLADEKVLYALDTWQRCLATGVWPGYPKETHYAEPPAWVKREQR